MQQSVPLVCVLGGVALVWWLQPWVLYYLLNHHLTNAGDDDSASSKKKRNENKGRLATAVYLCFAMMVTGILGYQLHATLRARSISVKPMLFIVLWYTIAMQFLRYLHLLSVGPMAFRRHFGLTSLKRTQLFMWSAPTIQFLPDAKKKDIAATDDDSTLFLHHSASSNLSWAHLKAEFRTALWDVVGMEVICAAVLLFHWGETLPLFLQALIRVYIMGFSTSVLKLLLECPSYYYILRQTHATDAEMIRIFPIYNRPHFTQSPRELWHRWSVTAGYHLRLAYYEPVMQRFRCQYEPLDAQKEKSTPASTTMSQRLVATAAPFAANCLLHITWWSIVVKGELEFIYWKLLFVYPLLSFAIQDILSQLMMTQGSKHRPPTKNSTSSITCKNAPSWQHWIFNILLMWMGFILIGEPMSTAHGLNSELTAVARSNLLLPP